MSEAVHASAAPVLRVWFCTVTVVVVLAVCTVLWSARFAACPVMFCAWQFQPVVAVACTAITPEEAVPPVPTLTRNAVARPAVTDGDVPKPLEMVGVANEKTGEAPILIFVPDDVTRPTVDRELLSNVIVPSFRSHI